jgi:hypothetical protein
LNVLRDVEHRESLTLEVDKEIEMATFRTAVLVTAAAMTFMAGCGKSNSLLGKWKVSAPTSGGATDVGCFISGFQFTPTDVTTTTSAAWNGGSSDAVTRTTAPVISYAHDGDNYLVAIKGGQKPLKLHLESNGFSIADAPQTSRCAHFVPDN